MQSITLIIPFGRDITLLRRNLDYYTEMGIQRILLSVHVRKEWEEGFLDAINEIIADYPAEIADIHMEEHNASKKRYEAVISKYCNNNDWVIVADLDEFYEYSSPLPDVVNFCEKNGYDYISGEFLDRLSPTGELADIEGNIWDTYPVGLKLTAKLGICANKVVLARAGVELAGGHHNALTGIGCPVGECSAIVHHFKWDSTCIERIQYMNSMQRRANTPWAIDSERMLQYLASNGRIIPIDDPALEAYWPIYKRSIPSASVGLQTIWEDPSRIAPKKLSSIEIHKQGDSDYLISADKKRSLKLNLSSLIILNLSDGFNSVSDITSITRDAYPAAWQSIEYSVQLTLRELYAAGFISQS